ncbi:3-isopropylmalate dehydratase large subunit, partial [Frankliniella fusca]
MARVQKSKEASEPLGGHNTNNYSEANVRVLKDIVLHRTRALNPVALLDFTVNHQALVHKAYPTRGLFPNAPAVTCDARYALGKLALGDKCPAKEYFMSLQEDIAAGNFTTTEQLPMPTIMDEETAM